MSDRHSLNASLRFALKFALHQQRAHEEILTKHTGPAILDKPSIIIFFMTQLHLSKTVLHMTVTSHRCSLTF